MNVMLFAAAMSVLSADPPEETCTLRGKLTVLENGKPSKGGFSEVYVDEGVKTQPLRTERKMSQLRRAFVPRVMVVEKEDTVVFVNEDTEVHEVHCDKDVNTFDTVRNVRPVTTKKQFTEVGVARMGCHVHDSMSALILTVPNRFHAHVADDGTWSISGLPRKALTLRVWNPRGTSEPIKVPACETKPIDTSLELSLPQTERGYGLLSRD